MVDISVHSTHYSPESLVDMRRSLTFLHIVANK